MNPKNLLKLITAIGVLSGSSIAIAAPVIDPVTSKVVNVVEQFRTINDHGTPSGFYRGNYDPTWFKHYQGVARHPTKPEVFYVSKSGDEEIPAAVMGVYLPSERDATHMNHNLWGNYTGQNKTQPNSGNVTFWERTHGNVCKHFGGLQASGAMMVVAAEHCGGNARLYIYDLEDKEIPESLVYRSGSKYSVGYIDLPYGTAGAAAVIEDAPGLYSVLVFADGNSKLLLQQFKKNGSELTSVYSNWIHLGLPSDQSSGWEQGTGAHQGISLIRQSDDKLFLMGFQRGVMESDHMYLYELAGISYTDTGLLKNVPIITYISHRKMYCTNWPDSGDRMCDFSAGAGVNIVNGKNGNKNGELTILAVAHDDDKGTYNNVAPVTEFRNRLVNVIDPSFGYCGHSSWVTLYDDAGINGDRNIMLTEANKNDEPFQNLAYSSLQFGDKTSAISYCVNPGCTFTAYKNDNYNSAVIQISASTGGAVFGYDTDLDSSSGAYRRVNWTGLGDTISSVKLVCN